MQTLSGSIDQSIDHLAPFEKAEYNLAKFALNANMSFELGEMLDRLKFLKSIKGMASVLSTSGSFKAGVEGYNFTVDKEISSLELAIRIYCEAYSHSIEA